ncbi:MAG: endonuclease domain-containing protein [Chloroflexota bacterium]
MGTDKARHLRRNMTEAESALWRRLRRRQVGGARFRRQAPIGPYIVDFACFEPRIVVEADGGQHAAQENADSARTRWLESQGFRVLCFWNSQVLGELEGVPEVIREAVEEADSPPS